MQARKTVQGKIVEKKIVCRTDEQIKLVQKLVKENCSSVRGFSDFTRVCLLSILVGNFRTRPKHAEIRLNLIAQ